MRAYKRTKLERVKTLDKNEGIRPRKIYHAGKEVSKEEKARFMDELYERSLTC